MNCPFQRERAADAHRDFVTFFKSLKAAPDDVIVRRSRDRATPNSVGDAHGSRPGPRRTEEEPQIVPSACRPTAAPARGTHQGLSSTGSASRDAGEHLRGDFSPAMARIGDRSRGASGTSACKRRPSIAIPFARACRPLRGVRGDHHQRRRDPFQHPFVRRRRAPPCWRIQADRTCPRHRLRGDRRPGHVPAAPRTRVTVCARPANPQRIPMPRLLSPSGSRKLRRLHRAA